MNNTAIANEVTIQINKHRFTVELALTQAERSQGLMHRKSLASDAGMLFIYHEPQLISFWMKQTLIPLDLLFFDKEGRLTELHQNIQPCPGSNCDTYTNKIPAQFVLELAAGTVNKFNFQVGNQFTIVAPE